MTAFTKPALSPVDQLSLLKSRGLKVSDDAFALRRLRHIGYYRLSGYMLPFQKGGEGSDRHTFNPGTAFSDVVDLYVFDRKLRLHFLDGIERVEISVRAALSGEIAVMHGPIWYSKPSLFKTTFNHTRYLDEIEASIDKSKDLFIEHYNKKYTTPSWPPSWMTFECVSFGPVSMSVTGMIPPLARELVADFGLPQPVLASWLHAISYVRNVCAHHGRLWNRVFTIKPMQPRSGAVRITSNDRLYAQALILLVLAAAVAPDTSWAKGLAQLLDAYPRVPLRPMGFDQNWRTIEPWKSALE